jgi:RNA polymerase sigma-70 factor (ECF subfamily)
VRIPDATAVTAAAAVWDGLEADAVAACLDLATASRRLTPVHQETLSLAVWERLSAPEAAAVPGVSPVAFRLRLSRAPPA